MNPEFELIRTRKIWGSHGTCDNVTPFWNSKVMTLWNLGPWTRASKWQLRYFKKMSWNRELSSRHNNFTINIFQWSKIVKYIVYSGPSIKKVDKIEGYSMGDDICQWVSSRAAYTVYCKLDWDHKFYSRLIKEKVKAPFVGRRSKKFPKGLQVYK